MRSIWVVSFYVMRVLLCIYRCSISQVHTFYEAVGLMIGAQTEPESQEMLIEKYMSLPNQVWDQVIARASTSVDVLKDPEVIKQLGNILKTNVRACKSLGHAYVKQVSGNSLQYKCYSETLSVVIG